MLKPGVIIADNYDHHHHPMLSFSNNDFYLSSCGGAMVLTYHWGDLASSHRAIDQQLVNILRAVNEPDQVHAKLMQAKKISRAISLQTHRLKRLAIVAGSRGLRCDRDLRWAVPAVASNARPFG